MRLWSFTFTWLTALLLTSSIAFAAPATIDTSTVATATSNSAQRKTFFDTLNNTHWAFYYNGTAIEYSYSADGTTWTSAGTLPYDTASFSVVYKTIAGTSYAFVVAEANSYDVVLRRATLDATSATFGAEQTVFDGTSTSDLYTKPTAAISENDHLWVSTIKDFGIGLVERFQVQVKRSTNIANGNVSAFNVATPIAGRIQKLQAAVILPQNGDGMYLISSVDDSSIVGYLFDGATWSTASNGLDYSWFSFGKSGLSVVDYIGVSAIAIIGADLFIGGNFIDADGDSKAANIARWDGNNWHPLGDGLNGAVTSLAVSGTDLYVGGNFTDAGGVANGDYIAKWDTLTETWSALGSGLSGFVSAIAITGTDVYVGGQFLNAGGYPNADVIARWSNVDNDWHDLGAALTSGVSAIAINGNNIYLGGSFSDAGGNANADKVVRFDSSDNSWNSLGTGLNGSVNSIAITGTRVYVGGSFTDAGGNANADRIAMWNTANSTWNALGSGISNGWVTTITIIGFNVYIGGSFINAGGNANADKIARYDWDEVSWNALDTGFSSQVNSIIPVGFDIYVGGEFTSAGGIVGANFIVKRNTDDDIWEAAYEAEVGSFYVGAIAVANNNIYVGGTFTDLYGNANADGIAYWDGNNWNSLGSGIQGQVFAITVSGSDIYVGGSFLDAGGNGNADRIARWDTTNSSWNALGTGLGNVVYAIATLGTDVYVAGNFVDAGGNGNADRIARWNTLNSSWNALGTGLSAAVKAMVVHGTDLYVGGGFSNVGGIAEADNIVRWNTIGSSWNALGTGTDSTVQALAVSGNNIYAGGSFWSAGGVANTTLIARWDTSNSSWNALGSGISVGPIQNVTSIAVNNGDVYAAGNFSTVSGVSAKNIARWNEAGQAWYALGSGVSFSDFAMSLSAVAVSGDYIFAGGQLHKAIDANRITALSYYGPAIASDADSTTEISAVSDSNGDVYLAYTDDTDQVKFRRFDESDAAWDATVTLNATASSSPSITYKDSDGRVTTSWVESNSINYSHSLTPYLAADWIAEDTHYSTGTNVGVTTAAHQETADLPVIWTNGVGNPYSVLAAPIDMSAPTVAITSGASNPTNVSPIPVTITFNKEVTGFVVGDITVGNGTAGNFVAVDATTYTADITPTGQGAVTVDVAGSVAVDVFANNNTAATQLTRTYDTVGPGVAISTGATNPTNSSPFSVTIQFDETVTGFVVGDITVGNGAAGNFVAVDGDTYTADITPTGDGVVTVDVAGSVAADAAGNDNTAATQLVRTYDNTIPTVTIANITTPINLSNRSAFPITGSCSENGRTVTLGATSSAGGAAVSTTATCGAGTWSKSLNLTGLNDATITFTADLDDAVGLDAVQASRTATKDTVVPTGIIATTSSSPTNITPIPITIEFSETVTGFAASDFSVTNGYVTNLLAVDGDSYTAHLVPSANGTVTVVLGADKVADIYDNGNTTTNSISVVFDSSSPLVTISSTESSPTTSQSIPLKIQFSEDVSGFTKSDITVTNGSLSGFTATSASIYEVTLKPKKEGDVTVHIAADAAEDENGNGNSAAAEYSISYEDRLICSVWNGFFSGEDQLVWNILEHVNLGTKNIGIQATLYSWEGEKKSSAEFTVEPGQQLDLLAHDMPGWIPDSYGLVCSKVVSGDPSKLDGRMVYYKRQPLGGFEYIFASPFTDGYTGEQYVGFNTYQPSLSTQDTGNFVANWIQITNLDKADQKGKLLFYNQEGELLQSKSITIKGRGQSDNSAHDWDGPTVGFVEWKPNSESAKFIVKNTRYLYDNALLENSFDGVVQLQASQGEKGVISAILDTAGASSVLEVANIRDKAVQTRARFYSSEGALLAELNFELPAHGSQHIVADSILTDGTGSVLVDAPGATKRSITATVFQYGRVENGSIAYLYGVSGVKPVGEILRGSYNTFLNQSCDIYLANSSSSTQTATISMQRNNGSQVFSNSVITLEPKQSVVSNICAAESEESYGVVTLDAGNPGVINSYLLRRDINDSYRYPIPVR